MHETPLHVLTCRTKHVQWFAKYSTTRVHGFTSLQSDLFALWTKKELQHCIAVQRRTTCHFDVIMESLRVGKLWMMYLSTDDLKCRLLPSGRQEKTRRTWSSLEGWRCDAPEAPRGTRRGRIVTEIEHNDQVTNPVSKVITDKNCHAAGYRDRWEEIPSKLKNDEVVRNKETDNRFNRLLKIDINFLLTRQSHKQ